MRKPGATLLAAFLVVCVPASGCFSLIALANRGTEYTEEEVQAGPGEVHVTSVPSGADIRANDRTLGTTPLRIPVPYKERVGFVRKTGCGPGAIGGTLDMVTGAGGAVESNGAGRSRRRFA